MVQQSIAITTWPPIVSNQVAAPLVIESFPKISRVQHEAPWFGRSQRDKQNKLPCFIDRYEPLLD
jgi:hypothetical protein